MLAGPAAQLAAAQPSSDGSSQPNIASESPANRAIGGGEDRAAQMELKLGSAGQAVVAVQRKLDVKATGYFDDKTDRAVRIFQGNNGLEVDGIVGPLTWRALFATGSTVPTAGIGGPDLEPAVATGDDVQVGNRTQFAVRMASDDELDSGERGELNAHRAATRSRDGGALVAIEFRAPEGQDTGESSASDNGRSASGARSGSNAGDRSQSDDGGSQGSSRGESRGNDGAGNDNGNSAGNGDSEPKPDNEGRPRNDGNGSSGSGSCSREIQDPLDGRGTHTSGYGPRWGRMHTGVDLAAPSGTPIRAAACGVISFLQGSSQSGGYGNFICIKHSSSFTTCYAHLSRFSNKGVGDYVRAGRIIGYVGSTGNSTGPHLHFETRTSAPYSGRPFDPTPYLRGRDFGGSMVRASSVGGPDLERREKASTASAQAASSEPEPSAVEIATDEGDSQASADTANAPAATAPESTEAEQPATEPAAGDASEAPDPANADQGSESTSGDDEGTTQEPTDTGTATEEGQDASAQEPESAPEPGTDGGEAGGETPSSEGEVSVDPVPVEEGTESGDSPAGGDSAGPDTGSSGGEGASDPASTSASGGASTGADGAASGDSGSTGATTGGSASTTVTADTSTDSTGGEAGAETTGQAGAGATGSASSTGSAGGEGIATGAGSTGAGTDAAGGASSGGAGGTAAQEPTESASDDEETRAGAAA